MSILLILAYTYAGTEDSQTEQVLVKEKEETEIVSCLRNYKNKITTLSFEII
jgi:hypothetical protein